MEKRIIISKTANETARKLGAPVYGYVGTKKVKQDIVTPLFLDVDGASRGDLIVYAGAASPSEWKGSAFSRLYCAQLLGDWLPFPEDAEREIGFGMYRAASDVDLGKLSEALTDGAMLAKRRPRGGLCDSLEYVVVRRVAPIEDMDARQTEDGFFCKCKVLVDAYECMTFKDPRSMCACARPFGEPGRIELELRLYIAKDEQAHKLSADCLFDRLWDEAWRV